MTSEAREILTLMRGSQLSLSRSARLVGISRSAAQKLLGKRVFKRGGRWVAKPWDRVPRTVRFLDDRGVFEVEVRDSRTASRIARYWNAVQHLLRSGDDLPLREFRGRSFQSHGIRYRFLTDPRVIRVLALVGQVVVEDMYASIA